jgi:hypothetical protein
MTSSFQQSLFDIRTHLNDREIIDFRYFKIGQDNIDSNFHTIETSNLTADGEIKKSNEGIAVIFNGNTKAYQCKIKIGEAFLGNGVGIRFRVRNWESIRYVAVGYTSGKDFRHVKIVHVLQEKWVAFSIGHEDLAFGIQNAWLRPDADTINDVRIFISGTPASDQSFLDIESCWCWQEKNSAPEWITKWENKQELTSIKNSIVSYLKKCFRAYEDQAKSFMSDGSCPIAGEVSLEWSPFDNYPSKLQEVGTYRFSWHSLHPAVILLLYAIDNQESAAIFAAREIVTRWIDKSFAVIDTDQKFAWYDHGTAERLMAFILMWLIGAESKFDYRFMTKLRLVIYRHGQLLSSDSFYARHQTTRYHNHAWFQDLALMTASLTFSDFICSKNWLETSFFRLKNQLENLVVNEGGYSIFVENSIGYHNGIQRLVDFAGEIEAISGSEVYIQKVANELPKFSKLLQYPDSRSPSTGDTFRRSNPNASQIRRTKSYVEPTCAFLSEAGYAVVKGNHDETSYMLSVFASSLCKTHKHADNLSFTLFFDGIEWLIDPSFFSHEYTSAIPAYLRSAIAHNALSIPENEYSIEPKLAYIAGNAVGENFIITGHHNCYSNAQIQRRISGNLNYLNLEFSDIALSDDPCISLNKPKLMLHFGEGVSVVLKDKLLVLDHICSDYELHIQLPNCEIELFHGVINEEFIRGVTGTSFMKYEKVYTVECSVAMNEEIKWNILAKRKCVL